MTPVLQLYNVFRNRWCGAYFASKGMRVVPTVSWGEENTFDFCFMGIPKGSTVAVSYTHLDVYKRQEYSRVLNSLSSEAPRKRSTSSLST